jgi:hypothetical protein
VDLLRHRAHRLKVRTKLARQAAEDLENQDQLSALEQLGLKPGDQLLDQPLATELLDLKLADQLLDQRPEAAQLLDLKLADQLQIAALLMEAGLERPLALEQAAQIISQHQLLKQKQAEKLT